MIKEAIETLAKLMDGFPGVFKLEIVHTNDITLHWCDGDEFKEKEFESSQQMVEFMEQELKNLN